MAAGWEGEKKRGRGAWLWEGKEGRRCPHRPRPHLLHRCTAAWLSPRAEWSVPITPILQSLHGLPISSAGSARFKDSAATHKPHHDFGSSSLQNSLSSSDPHNSFAPLSRTLLQGPPGPWAPWPQRGSSSCALCPPYLSAGLPSHLGLALFIVYSSIRPEDKVMITEDLHHLEHLNRC